MDRPTFIDLDLDSRATSSAGTRTPAFPSPRLQHNDGDIPPSLSPLDALAAHSRKLARELEDTRRAGERRLSRLPPQLVNKSLSDHQKSRPPIFRALSDLAESSPSSPPPASTIDKDGLGLSPQFSIPSNRPTSSYPRISGVMNSQQLPKLGLHQISQPIDYFGPPVDSPTSIESVDPSLPYRTSPNASFRRNHHPTSPRSVTSSNRDLSFDLPPPNAAFARKNYVENSDDEYTSSNAGSTFSQTRKLSSSSAVSLPQSPASPVVLSHARSGSNNSVVSLTKSRTHLNFSRPMSTSSMSNLKASSPVRKPSKTSLRSQPSMRSHEIPKSSMDDSPIDNPNGYVSGEATSYTHASYTLPRGRMADRTSAVFLGLSTPHFEWSEPMFPSTPPIGPVQDSEVFTSSQNDSTRPSAETTSRRGFFSFDLERKKSRPSEENDQPPSTSHTPKRLTKANPHTSPEHSSPTPENPPTLPNMNFLLQDNMSVSHSSQSDATIRPTPTRMTSNYQALTADEYVNKAIDLHQHGDLKESTYLLRIAAKQDHPTAMLLYALACRHGWGMRPNQKEGVQWLRKAVDIAMAEIAEDENVNNDRPHVDANEKKAHRTQFALSIYELGVSHMNGWGVEQDKALALRCFEIAGAWGDVDALTEAGFCYAEGIGCKKDLKKAAKFYRMAEERGVSMVGNSW